MKRVVLLLAFAGAILGDFRAVELGHGGDLLERLVILLQPAGFVEYALRGFDPCRHFGELEADCLVLAYRLAERRALQHALRGHVERA